MMYRPGPDPFRRFFACLALAGLGFSLLHPARAAHSRFAAPRPSAAQAKKQQQREEALRLHSDLVLVSLTVTDAAGRYVHGLTATDFRLVEDGVPQTIDSFSAEEAPFAAAILIDMSGSMEYKFGLVRGAAASFLDHIGEGDQVAVYGFNRQVRVFQEFSGSHDISDYVWDAKAEDETRLYDCMNSAVEALAKRPERRRAELVITDGWDTASTEASRDSVIKKALAAGVTVYTVDLTDDSLLIGNSTEAAGLMRGRKDLQEFARQTGGSYIHSPQGDKLEAAFTSVVEELRNQYTLAYYSTNPKRDGRWRALGASPARAGLSIRTRRGYFAPKG